MHGVDVEGKQQGIDPELVDLLGKSNRLDLLDGKIARLVLYASSIQ